jgi:hypothetical protein
MILESENCWPRLNPSSSIGKEDFSVNVLARKE